MPVPKVSYIFKPNGNGVRDWQIRVRNSNNIPPTYVNCSTITLSDASWAPALTAYGRSKFEVPDDVQSAIDAAVAEAMENLIGAEAAICENSDEIPPCWQHTPSSGTETVNDATVTAQVYWSYSGNAGLEPGDPWYEECNDDLQIAYGSNRLKLDITAPQKPGVDLREVLESISIGYAPLDEVIAEILAGDTVATDVSGQFIIVLDEGGSDERAALWAPGGGLAVRRRLSGVDRWATSFYGTEVIDGDTTYVSDYDPDQSRYTDADGVEHDIPGAFPSSFTITNQDNSPIELNLEIPFTNNWDEPDPTKWHLATDYDPDPSDIVRSSGYLSAATEYNTYLKDPGFKSYCQWDLTYTNAHPGLPLCNGNEMELNVYTENGYKRPVGKRAKCLIKISPVRTGDA